MKWKSGIQWWQEGENLPAPVPIAVAEPCHSRFGIDPAQTAGFREGQDQIPAACPQKLPSSQSAEVTSVKPAVLPSVRSQRSDWQGPEVCSVAASECLSRVDLVSTAWPPELRHAAGPRAAGRFLAGLPRRPCPRRTATPHRCRPSAVPGGSGPLSVRDRNQGERKAPVGPEEATCWTQ